MIHLAATDVAYTATYAAPSTMLRRPTPATAACSPARPLRVVITGTLLEDATASTEPATSRAAFSVALAQGDGAPTVFATRWVGDGPEAAFHATDRAQSLRAGDTVTVHGDGLRLRYHHGALAIVVALVRDIELVQGRAEPAV